MSVFLVASLLLTAVLIVVVGIGLVCYAVLTGRLDRVRRSESASGLPEASKQGGSRDR